MAHIPRTLRLLAGLAVGGSALQVTADVGGSVAADAGGSVVCGKGMLQFEHTSKSDPDLCIVYCLPQGPCEGHLQLGHMKNLQITGQGDCLHKGFTQLAEMGNQSRLMAMRARHFQGCEHAQVLQFQRPAGEEAPVAPVAPTPRQGQQVPKEPPAAILTVCGGWGLQPYRYIRRGSGECLLYCVPRGMCERMASKNMIPGLQMTARGDCLGKGFGRQVELDAWSSSLFDTGPCKGMSLMKFEKVAAAAPRPQRLAASHEEAPMRDPILELEAGLLDEEAATMPMPQQTPAPQPQFPDEVPAATPELLPERRPQYPDDVPVATPELLPERRPQYPDEVPAATPELSPESRPQYPGEVRATPELSLEPQPQYPDEVRAATPELSLEPQPQYPGEVPAATPELSPEPQPQYPGEVPAATPELSPEPRPQYPGEVPAATPELSPEPQPQYPDGVPAAAPDLSSEPEPTLTCRDGETSYTAITRYNDVDMCTRLCLPEGACRGDADAGDLIHLGITAPGTCSAMGFPVPVPMNSGAGWPATWLAELQGLCNGTAVLGTFVAKSG